MKIARNLRKLRMNRGISQIEMAQKLSISRQAYNHYETGKRIPPIDMLDAIAKILNINIQYLIQDENNPISIEEAIEQNTTNDLTEKKDPSNDIEESEQYVRASKLLRRLTPENLEVITAVVDGLISKQEQ